MAILAAFIACHPAMGLFGLANTFSQHQDKVDQLKEGTYSLGRAVTASLQTFVEAMALGSVAFFFTLPIALLFGLSAHALLIKSGFWKKRHYALAGAFFGTVAYIYFINWTQGGLGIGALAFIAANSASLIFALFNGAQSSTNLIFEPLKYIFHPALLGTYAVKLAVASLLFTGIYIVLRRMKRTGWIAFALAGLIDGTIAGLVDHTKLAEGVVTSAFIYAVAAIIFRGLLGRVAATEKGRNISAPAS